MVIIAVSYDSASLNRRMEALQQLGHVVVPVSSLDSCRIAVEGSNYHLLLIGATVPNKDRQELANISRALRPLSKIISVQALGSLPLRLADKQVAATDETALLMAINSIISEGEENDFEEGRR